eukprot:5194194-Karenia_brevis.AAC.1
MAFGSPPGVVARTSASSSKGKGKGGKKGKKGKESGKQQEFDDNPQKLKVKANGRNICFKYNNEGETCPGSCGMVHVCQWCLGNHPKFKCDKHRN